MIPYSQNERSSTEAKPGSRGLRDAPRGAPSAPSDRAGLGTHAKFQATSNGAGFHGVDAATGEVQGPQKDLVKTRLERFALQSVVRRILPNSRTANCLRLRQKNANVEVYRSAQHGRAHYGGLQTCASVWACPVCSAKIAERRRQELKHLIAAHREAGGSVLFITRTAPHSRTDALGDLLAQLAKAEASYKAHRDYKALAKSLGVVGTVKATEVTYGEANGFHPHVHELVFITGDADIAQVEDALFEVWKAAASRAGFRSPSRAHGLTVQHGDYADKYVSKWGLESEMTQWHRKRGRASSLTPFDLLRWYLADDDERAAYLFRIYAEEFRGRHQLQFSRGLKKLYALVDVSDEELAARQDDDAQLLGRLSVEEWRAVVSHDQRGALLEVAALRGWEGVQDMLRGLLKRMSSERNDEHIRFSGGGS